MNNNLLALWAKRPKTDDDESLLVPLQTHLGKTVDKIKKLNNTWLPPILQRKTDEKLLVFLACAHDIGKASPAFQTRRSNAPQTDEKIRKNLEVAGFHIKERYHTPEKTRHELISHAVLKRHGLDKSVCVIVGGHHGFPTPCGKIDVIEDSYKSNCGFDRPEWVAAQDALFTEALEISGLSLDEVRNIRIKRPDQVLYSGILIFADWLASCEDNIELPSSWKPQNFDDMYIRRFKLDNPHPVQHKLVEAVKEADSPGIFVVEAPMGEGKTEAALAAAEILAEKIGCRGVYFALPSQATSNAMLTRVKEWMETFEPHDGPLSMRLSHGKADLNEDYQAIRFAGYHEEDEPVVTVHSWLTGPKKGMLADFVVGTIDHVLMAGLKQKHLVLRHLGLANKVLIVDECHAYDVYMESYLITALKWLGAYGVPVIILSATLPAERRTDLVRAYLNDNKRSGIGGDWTETTAYPLITYTDGNAVKSLPITAPTQGRSVRVGIKRISGVNLSDMVSSKDLLDNLEQALANGGCAGVIFNTVKKAQKVFTEISDKFGSDNVELLHSGFIFCDREKRESDLVLKLGNKSGTKRPEKRIVVGTQVFEQSLDIDFDVMFTELCPVDLLLQRIGRLHRHDRGDRPVGLTNPTCYVMGAEWGNFDKGSTYVYGEYLLMRTCAILQETDFINLPGDIPQLVAQVYNCKYEIDVPEEFVRDYRKATDKWKLAADNRKDSAKSFQIKGSIKDKTIVGWLDSSPKESEGEAVVRDGIDTVEVLIVQHRNGRLCFLPWIRNGEELSPYYTPTVKQVKALERCSVRLPFAFNHKISDVIKSIESAMLELKEAWYQSHWLDGALILILDEEQNVTHEEITLHYDEFLGLSVVEKSNSLGE